MVQIIAGSASVAIGIVAFVVYWASIYRGKTKPHPLSHLAWGILSGAVAWTQFKHGAAAGAWAGIATSISYFVTAAWSYWIKNWLILRTDWVSFAMAIISMLLCILSSQPIVFLSFVTLSTLAGFFPTMRKAWLLPYEENLLSASFNIGKFALSLLAIHTFNFFTAFYPIFFLTIGILFVCVCQMRRAFEKTRTDQLAQRI